MKLPAASCGMRNSAEALPALALSSYGVVASPFLSAASGRVSRPRRANLAKANERWVRYAQRFPNLTQEELNAFHLLSLRNDL